jgi:dolichol-phosphate mannosyltransferase
MISIVLATYNERKNIKTTIQELFKHIKKPLEVIVVDDNSPDNTAKVVESLKNPNVKLIKRIRAKGLATAFNRGIIESKGDIVGWMDADVCMPPSLVPKMIEYLDKYDIVIGSRYVEGGKDLRPPIRVITSKMINWFAGLLLGFDIKDYDSGFIVLKREVFNSVTLSPKGYGSYFIEFLFDAKKKGLKIKEVPYIFRDRTEGLSKSMPNYYTLIKLGMEYGLRIISTRLKRTR